MTIKTRIILSIIIIIGTIFFTLRAQKSEDQTFTSVAQEEVALPLDTIRVTISYIIEPYTQLYKRTKKNRFDISKNEGKIIRTFFTDFSDTTDTVIAIDTSLPNLEQGEHSSLAFYGKTFSQDYMFCSANGATNVFKNPIAIDYLVGDSTAKNIKVAIKESGKHSLLQAYRSQLRVESQPIAEYLVAKYLEKNNFVGTRFHVLDSMLVEELPETSISVKNDILTYEAKGTTKFVFVYRSEVPKK